MPVTYPPAQNPADAKGADREKIIVKTSAIGIIANVFLAGFKAAVGLMTHSIAIVLDAVNNISDAGSSLITIVGTKLAGREPDKKHPFGYGRIEYLSAMIISMIVLYAGITSFVESVKQIIQPETPDYSAVSLIIVGVAVAVLSLPAVFGYNVWRDVRLLPGKTILDVEDFVFSQFWLPLGALATCVFCAWSCGWGWKGFREEAGAGAGLAPPRAWAPYMRWLLPAVLLGIIFGGVRG